MDKYISTEVLRQAYKQALIEGHNEDFIELLRDELTKKESIELEAAQPTEGIIIQIKG